MSYVLFEVETSRLISLINNRYSFYYKTEAAAKAAKTRFVKSGEYAANAIGISEASYYREHIEQMREVTNLMSGKKVLESVNTSSACSVGSETYWSM